MARQYLSALNLNDNELLKARLENISTGLLPTPTTALKGKMVFDTTASVFKFCDGTSWIDPIAVSGPPSGAAGGDLAGTYPNPTIAAGAVVNADVNAAAAIARTKLDFGAGLVNADIAAAAAIAYSKLSLAGSVTNADVATGAAIAYSKLSLGTSIVNADISASAAIAYTKLNLGGTIVNADVNASAAIARTKLDFGTGLVNADIAAAAAIALSKLATDPLARANHTGTQASSTISDLATVVKAYRLDEFANPTSARTMNAQKITGLADPTAAQDAATKAYVDSVSIGLDVKASVRVASTANLAVASAVVNGAVVDGITLATGDRILLKNQSAPAENGIYIVAASGAASRSTDADVSAEVTSGMFTFVESGTVGAATGWILSTSGAITLGTTGLTFTQFSGAGTYLAGTGLTLTGSTFSIGTGAITSTMLLDGTILNADVNASAAIARSKLDFGSGLVNADIAAGAAITYAKLSLGTSIVNADIAAAAGIVYSKLNLGNSVVNADIAAGAAIAYSKLNLSASIVSGDIVDGTIVNADINASAAIAFTKLATPTADVAWGTNKITGLKDPTLAQDAATKAYVDAIPVGLKVVRLATNAQQALTGAATIDGSAIVTGDRILVTSQTAGAENGIYIANTAGAWTRATDFDSAFDIYGAVIMVTAGTDRAGMVYDTRPCMPTPGTTMTVGTTTISFGSFLRGSYDNGGVHATGASFIITQATHGLAKGGPFTVQAYLVSTGEQIDCDVTVNFSTGDVTIGFAVSQSANTVRIFIAGGTTTVSPQLLDNSVTAAKIASALKGGAAAGTEALRAIGTTATTACAGDDARLSNTRTPSASSVTRAMLATGSFKAERFTGSAVGASSRALQTCTWASPFADANYTVVASTTEAANNAAGVWIEHIYSISASAVVVALKNDYSGGAITPTIQLIAIHD